MLWVRMYSTLNALLVLVRLSGLTRPRCMSRSSHALAHQQICLQVVFATAVTKPGHGSIAPLAIGFTLFASAFVGGPC